MDWVVPLRTKIVLPFGSKVIAEGEGQSNTEGKGSVVERSKEVEGTRKMMVLLPLLCDSH